MQQVQWQKGEQSSFWSESWSWWVLWILVLSPVAAARSQQGRQLSESTIQAVMRVRNLIGAKIRHLAERDEETDIVTTNAERLFAIDVD